MPRGQVNTWQLKIKITTAMKKNIAYNFTFSTHYSILVPKNLLLDQI